MYKLAIIGSGPGGLKCVLEGIKRGFSKILLVEKDVFGGVCLNRGCIPTKFFVQFLSSLKGVNSCQELITPQQIDFEALVQKREKIIEGIRKATQDYVTSKGVEFVSGDAQLFDNKSLMINGQEYVADNIVIASGSLPRVFDGFPDEKTYTPESAITRITKKVPSTVLIVGGGAIGIEFASIMRALGSTVTLVEKEERILPFMDKELTQRLASLLKREGITIKTGTAVSGNDADAYEAVILAAGRRPQTSFQGKMRFVTTPAGYLKTDELLRTSVKNIFACGDCTGEDMYAYTAEAEAEAVCATIAGTLTPARPLVYPQCIFSLPSLAWVGLTEEQALAQKRNIVVRKSFLLENSSAHVLGDKDGMVKIVLDADKDQILGGGVLSKYAPEIIHCLYLAVSEKLPRSSLRRLIFAHPTISESIHKIVD